MKRSRPPFLISTPGASSLAKRLHSFISPAGPFPKTRPARFGVPEGGATSLKKPRFREDFSVVTLQIGSPVEKPPHFEVSVVRNGSRFSPAYTKKELRNVSIISLRSFVDGTISYNLTFFTSVIIQTSFRQSPFSAAYWASARLFSIKTIIQSLSFIVVISFIIFLYLTFLFYYIAEL